MKKLVPIMLCAISFILAGCGQKQVASTTPTNVKWSSLPAREQQAITEVSKHFGDVNPTVVKITQDVTEADQQLMFLVWLDGHFHEGKVQSKDLSFSILADGTMAWAITNKSGSFKNTEELSLH